MKNLIKVLLISLPLCFASFAMAEESPTQTIAMIISHLNHFPSADEKQKLAAIAADEEASEATRTLASALANVQHKANPADVAALEKVVAEADSSDAEKKLAKIIMGINHKPSAEDLAVLEGL